MAARSPAELIGKGIEFGRHAIHCDREACSTNEPTYYERAEANYEKAIELYSDALRIEPDPVTHEMLSPKIDNYRQRCNVMKQWLMEYKEKQKREQVVRRNSKVHTVFPYVEDNAVQTPRTQDPNRMSRETLSGSSNGYTPARSQVRSPPSRSPQQGPVYLPQSTDNQSGPLTLPEPDSTPDSLEATEPPPPGRLSSARSWSGSGMTKPSPKSDLEKLTADIDSLLLSNRDPPKARWDDVAGLSVAKDVLREASTMPHELPTMFGAERQRWKSVLLYGPPGCGKRILAEAAAAAYHAPLLAPRVQDILELMSCSGSAGIRALFANAKKRGRAVLYLSELEEVVGVSTGGGSATVFRQARAQLLDELLALRKEKGEGLLFVGASRTPWELDDALVSRVERRVYVGLPDAAARAQILEVGLRNVAHDITLQEIEDMAVECEGYSPSDLGMLVRDAAMEPVRTVRSAGWFRNVSVVEGVRKVAKKTPCERDTTGAVEMRFTEIDQEAIEPPPVKCLDFDLAMTSTKPSVSEEMIKRYVDFTRKKGQDGS